MKMTGPCWSMVNVNICKLMVTVVFTTHDRTSAANTAMTIVNTMHQQKVALNYILKPITIYWDTAKNASGHGAGNG